MPYFDTDAAVYDTLGRLLTDLAHSGGAGRQLRSTNSVVQLALSDPNARITMRLSDAREPVVEFGPPRHSPTITLSMSADVAHRIFLGATNLLAAVNAGDVVLDGAAVKLLSSWPAIAYSVPRRYRQMLELAGRAELIDV